MDALQQTFFPFPPSLLSFDLALSPQQNHSYDHKSFEVGGVGGGGVEPLVWLFRDVASSVPPHYGFPTSSSQ